MFVASRRHSATSPKIIGAITHFDEITVDLCRHALEHQSVGLADIITIAGISPASEAFNQCLLRARASGADLLLHVAADCILHHDAVAKMAARMKADNVYAVIARGFDMMNGNDAPIGAWALNLKIISEEFYFRDAFKMDLDFCGRIEEATGAKRLKTKRGLQLGCHHPIWLPREIYQKFRYNAPKYRSKEIRKYLKFFEKCLASNPDNKVLQVGLMGLNRGAADVHQHGGPLRSAFEREWIEIQEVIEFDGSEFFAYHEDFVHIARELLNSDQPIAPMAGSFFESRENRSQFHGIKSTAPEQRIGAISWNQISSNARLSLGVRRRMVDLYRRGKSLIRHVGRPIYSRLPNPAKDIVHKCFRRAPVTPVVRKFDAARQPFKKYGAVNVGRIDWEIRWNNSEQQRRVLLVAPKDFAGSMYRWAEAVNKHTDFAARLVSFESHQYNYPVDLIVPECDEKRLLAVLELANEAGYLHLKDEHSWFLNHDRFTNLRLIKAIFFSNEFSSVPKIFTHYGGYARKFKNDASYIDAVQGFDARVAMTPDLNYPWFGGAFIPHTIDVDHIPFTWSDTKIFAHSPSSPEKKATYLFTEAAIFLPRQHSHLWEGWSTDLITGVSFEECIRRKQRASLFFDQAGRHRVADLGIDDIIGWYGNSAVEAMAFGIPTIAHLSGMALEQAAASGVDLSDNPIINFDRTRKNMVEVFVEFASLEPKAREDLARRTRQFTERFHGYKACGIRLADLYAALAPAVKSTKQHKQGEHFHAGR